MRQLIFYHYERVFLHTAGVEGQVAMSVIFLAWAVLVSIPSVAPYSTVVADVVAVIVSLSTMHLDWFYVQRFKERSFSLLSNSNVCYCTQYLIVHLDFRLNT